MLAGARRAPSTAARTNPFPGATPLVIGNGRTTTKLDALALQVSWGGLRDDARERFSSAP